MSAICDIRASILANSYNAKVTLYPDESGSYSRIAKIIVANRQIFHEGEAVRSEGCGGKSRNKLPELIFDDEEAEEREEHRAAENLQRAQRRAYNRVRDLVSCNEWKWFITFTLDSSRVNRDDYDGIISKLNVWLSNRVQRHGLRYVIVPEFHADGAAIHFHGVVNELPEVVYSGKRKRYASGTKRVYNVPDWPYGFSTAIRCSGDSAQVGGYIAKYITKESRKVGGRYFLHGGKLREPRYMYFNCNYDDVEQSNECSIEAASLRLKYVKHGHFTDFLPPDTMAGFMAYNGHLTE